VSVWKLFLIMLWLTSLSFGGGAAIEVGLQSEVVRPGVLNNAQFAAAMAIGKSTPGPLASFATAVGQKVAGYPGAIAATLALILVSLTMVVVMRAIPRTWFALPAVKAGLKAVGPCLVGFIFFLAYQLGYHAIQPVWYAAAGIAGMVFVGRLFKVPTVWLMAGGVLIGMLVQGTSIAGW
jgi:chromate transporter